MEGNLTFGNEFFHEYKRNHNYKIMKIAWTTTETLEQARVLARQVIHAKLAACAQISSPITSLYHWKGSIQESTEFRLTFKLPNSKLSALKQLVLEVHPYETPQ